MRAGDRLPAESKLAAQFDVSRMTLRSAMEVLVREGMIRRKRNLGCYCSVPAKTQESLMSHTIVLLTDHETANDGQIFGGTSASIVSGIIGRAGKHGKHFLRANLESGDSVGQLIDARPLGVIMSCWHQSFEWQLDTLMQLSAHQIPVVVNTDTPLLEDYDCVASDHVGGTRQLVRALASQNKKRILRLWTQPATTPYIVAHNRGYESAVQELGLANIPAVYSVPVPGVLPSHVETQTENDFRIRVRYFAGYLAEHLHSDSPVDAIMVSTDTEVLSILAACRLFGRTDIAVTGYDNHWQNKLERQWEPGIPFATVDKNNHRIGEEMVELLLARIAGNLPQTPQKKLIEQQVILTSTQGAAWSMP